MSKQKKTLSFSMPQTLIVRCPNWVGDVVMATPAMDCLRNNFKDTKIIGVIRPYARRVIDDGPWFDDIISINDTSIGGLLKLITAIKNYQADSAILMTRSIRSKLSIFFGRVKHRYGYLYGGAEFLLNGGPEPVRSGDSILPVPMKDYYLELCRFLQLKLPAQPKPSLFISEELKRQGQNLLAKLGILPKDMVIGINPGAKFGSSKCWPAKYFAELAELIYADLESKLLLFCGPGEEALADEIISTSKAPIINTAKDKVDLGLLKPLVKRCSLLVTNDTGPRHYAVAFNVPAVVIMGPTDPRYTAVDLENTIVLREELECSPCHLKTCRRDHECMTMIKPAVVLKACQELLDRSS